MNESQRQAAEQCAHESHAGIASFPDIVGRLAQAGIGSYLADYRAARTTYFAREGGTHDVALAMPAQPIAPSFDATALQAAIRGAQRGEVKYPRFLELSAAAGCVGYIVWIDGRHVVYFGALGEQHVERFPDAP
jgi:uncharacterized protein YbcV (DUF1398 family)